jgi:signal peptidase
MRRVLGFAGKALATVVLITGTFALLAGVVVPRLAGATPYTVLTGSMEPVLPVGTLVIAGSPGQIGIGDIVTYQIRSGDPMVATHRVIGVGTAVDGEPTFITKGDANQTTDPGAVRLTQVRGTLWYYVPYLGYLSALLSSSERQLGVLAVAVALLGYAAWQVVRARRERAAGAAAVKRESPAQPQSTSGHEPTRVAGK